MRCIAGFRGFGRETTGVVIGANLGINHPLGYTFFYEPPDGKHDIIGS